MFILQIKSTHEVLDTTFNYIEAMIILAASNCWQTLSQKVVSSTPQYFAKIRNMEVPQF
jgi:hypothetical protein